jgi:hypothetical protein
MLCWVMYCVIFQIVVIRSILFCHSWREATDHGTSRKKRENLLAGTKQTDTQRFSMAVFSPPSNLALGKRRHPTHQQVETNDHASHNPKALRIVRAVESEQNREDDAAEIAHGAYRTAQDAIGVRVDVWDEGEVGSADLDVSEDEDERGQWKGRKSYPLPASKKNAIPAISPNIVVSSCGLRRPMAIRKAPEMMPTKRIQPFFSQRLVETCL